MKSSLRRLIAGAGALTLGVAGAFALGATASAQENQNVGPDQPGAPAEGTLTINKYAGAHTETPNQEDLLDGVEFTITRVGLLIDETCEAIDLTDAAQWDGLDDLFDSAPATPSAPFCLTDVVQADVTEDGQVDFDLDVGVYFVEETDPGANPIVSVVPNFYVSIPTSLSESGDGWNYNVVADPKNQLMNEPTKTIEDQVDLVVGGNVTWTLSVPIPELNNDDVFESASITDVLDERLSHASSTLSIDGEDLIEDTHYELNTDGVTWTFLEDGLDLLYDHQGEDITVELVTTVNEVGNGTIPNDDYSSEFNGATVPGETVPYTYWGQLSILKVDDSDTPLPLAGAEFQVFDLAAGTTCETDAPETGAVATGTSDDAGIVQWDFTDPATSPLGLWVANSTDGELEAPSKDYCVYETVVPAGHSAIAIENPVTITPGEDAINAITAVNPRTEGPDLPLTGGAGTVALMTGGALLFGAGVAVMLVARRRRILAA